MGGLGKEIEGDLMSGRREASAYSWFLDVEAAAAAAAPAEEEEEEDTGRFEG